MANKLRLMNDDPMGRVLSAPIVIVLKTRGRPPETRMDSLTALTMLSKCV